MENSKIAKVKEFLKKRKIAVIVILILLLSGIAAGVGIAVHNSGESGNGGTAGTTAAETTATATESETDADSTVEPAESESETEGDTEVGTETEKEDATVAPETEAQTEVKPADSETKAQDNKEPEPTYVGVASVTLDRAELSLTVGQSVQPVVTMAPANANNKGEIWTSNNTRVASVDQEGNIVATGAGECVVTVNSADNVYASASVKVTVTDPNANSQAVETVAVEEKPKVVQAADLKTGISWDGKSAIVYTYPDGTTGTEMKVGATYESLPGMTATVIEQDMPGYVAPKYDGKCSDCGKTEGDGTNGTCVSYKFLSGDMPCPSCGEIIPEDSCHTCK